MKPVVCYWLPVGLVKDDHYSLEGGEGRGHLDGGLLFVS